MKKLKNRRQFLKNTALSTLTVGALRHLPMKAKASGDPSPAQPTCDETTLDLYGQGPFYTENPPVIENNLLASEAEPGVRLLISGRVLNLDCNEYLPDTIVDIWHANDAGEYDNVGYNLRGVTQSNEQGFYMFETILPGKYLNGASFRPAHIHFRITPPGFPTLITQLYFQGDSDILGDAAASVTSGQFDATHRIISLNEMGDGSMEGTWDIVLNGDGEAVGLNDIYLSKGMIYTLSPNPFRDRLKIDYGVFNAAKVGLMVFDIEGRLITTLEERNLGPEKYSAYWQPESFLPSGFYFIALKINDLQVHYQKVVFEGS